MSEPLTDEQLDGLTNHVEYPDAPIAAAEIRILRSELATAQEILVQERELLLADNAKLLERAEPAEAAGVVVCDYCRHHRPATEGECPTCGLTSAYAEADEADDQAASTEIAAAEAAGVAREHGGHDSGCLSLMQGGVIDRGCDCGYATKPDEAEGVSDQMAIEIARYLDDLTDVVSAAADRPRRAIMEHVDAIAGLTRLRALADDDHLKEING